MKIVKFLVPSRKVLPIGNKNTFSVANLKIIFHQIILVVSSDDIITQLIAMLGP